MSSRSALGALALAFVMGLGTAHADPVLMRSVRGGRVFEVDRVEDVVSLLAREYEPLSAAETAAWKQQRQKQESIDSSIQREAEDRSVVYITGVLLTLFVLGTFVFVYWVRNHSKLR